MVKVMVVDDSAFTRKMMRMSIEELDCEVVEAEGGVEALKMYARESPDLVTLDLLMPEMEGPEVLSCLKEVDPAVNVVICSSNVQADARQDVMDRGAVAFLNKPVRPDDLKPVLEEVLRGRESD
jgi:two-component system chemotaxis response regulator CheY